MKGQQPVPYELGLSLGTCWASFLKDIRDQYFLIEFLLFKSSQE